VHASTPEFAETIRGDYRSHEQVEFVYAEGDPGPVFDVISGDFQIDAGAEIRHNASLRLVSGDVAPAALRDALRAPGTTVQYSRGMIRSDGVTELKRVLTGEIATGSLRVARNGIDPLPVTVFDSMTRLQWPATSAFGIPGGMNYVTGMRKIVEKFAPHVKWADIMSTPYAAPSLAFATETQVSGVLQDMAKAIGASLHFDAFNELNLAPVPLTTGRPSTWTFDLDTEGSGVISADLQTNYDNMPNVVVVTGQHSSGNTVTAEAADGAPASPTYHRGEYGRRPIFVRTEKVITSGQAAAMARGLLQKVLGGSFQIVLEIIPNPLLTLGDMCEVRSVRLGVNDPFIVQAISGAAGREEIGQPWRLTLRRGVIPETLEAG
jgi:hypothetical protein